MSCAALSCALSRRQPSHAPSRSPLRRSLSAKSVRRSSASPPAGQRHGRPPGGTMAVERLASHSSSRTGRAPAAPSAPKPPPMRRRTATRPVCHVGECDQRLILRQDRQLRARHRSGRGLVRGPLIMEVNPSFPAKTVPEFWPMPGPIPARSTWRRRAMETPPMSPASCS